MTKKVAKLQRASRATTTIARALSCFKSWFGWLEEKGHIEGAVHIPLRDLGKHIDLLPAFDTPIVAYCGSGWRATVAMTALNALGWTDVRALKNLYADWVEAGYATGEGLPPEAIVLDVAMYAIPIPVSIARVAVIYREVIDTDPAVIIGDRNWTNGSRRTAFDLLR